MNTGNNTTQPPTPTEVLKLVAHLQTLKPFAICSLLECSTEQSEQIALAFDRDEFASAMYMIGFCGDQAIAQAIQTVKGLAL